MRLIRLGIALALCCLTLSAQTTVPDRKDSIVVTGTYEPVPLKESDRSVKVFDLGTAELLLFGSAADVLKLDPSIDLQERAPDGVQADMTIRGGTFGQSLVLLNGFRLNDVQSGHHNFDIPIPFEALTRIEILKGSGSTFYGSDAVDGAVDLIARPPESGEVRLRAAAGNFGINEESAVLSGVIGRVTEELAFSRDFSTGFEPDRDYRNLQMASITHATSKLGATDLLFATGDRPFGADQFYGAYPSWERTRQWFASIRQELGPDTEVDFAYRRHTDLFVLFRDDPEIYTNRHADETYQAAIRRRNALGLNVSLHYGLEGYHDAIVSNNLGDHSRNHGAVYGSLDVRALGRFSLSLSAREELYTPTSGGGLRTELSPSAAGAVWLSSKLRLKASASTSFRLPSYTDLYYNDPANMGSPYLRPEHAATYEAGAEWFSSLRLRAYATIFDRREHDGIDYVRNSPDDIWRATNFDQLQFVGVETGVSMRLGAAQQVEIAYTGLHGSEAATTVMSKYVFNYPSGSATVAWQGALKGGFVARSRVGVVNRRARAAYALWDVSATSTRGRVHPFLRLSNLTNADYQEILGVAMPGRTTVGGVEYVVFGKTK